MLIAVVEDEEQKWRDITSLLANLGFHGDIPRATTLIEAERLLDRINPDLLILDISMNIAGPSNIASRGTHANIGGVEIVERLYLLEKTCPTIILTGFDVFKNGNASSEGTMDLSSLTVKLRKLLGTNLLSTIKYGSEGWSDKMCAAIKKRKLQVDNS